MTSHLNVLTFSHLIEGCSEGLDAFRFFSENKKYGFRKHLSPNNILILLQNSVVHGSLGRKLVCCGTGCTSVSYRYSLKYRYMQNREVY